MREREREGERQREREMREGEGQRERGRKREGERGVRGGRGKERKKYQMTKCPGIIAPAIEVGCS